MKRIVILASALMLCTLAFAQEEKPAHFKFYGFVRNYLTADSRAVNAGTEDLYFYMPKDLNMKDGVDLNAGFNWRYVSLTTRLGVDITGYKWGSMGVFGKIEADFYNLSSFVPILRLRQAYIKLNWDNVPLALSIGQTWHPLAADMPHMNNLETGAPFNPFNRSPQLTLDWKVGNFTITASMLYLNHYLPVGPNGKSKEYFLNGLPEFYAGVAFRTGGFLAKAGVDIVNTRPYKTYQNKVANGFMTGISPFLFLQYGKDLFQIKAKAILAQSGEHLNMLSGYGVASYNEASNTFVYTPMQNLGSWISFSYGKKFQVMCMVGYMKNLGTTADLKNPDTMLWLNTVAGSTSITYLDEGGNPVSTTQPNVCQAFRATPTVAWNFGKFCVSLEYNYTLGEYGNPLAHRNFRGLYAAGDTHWVHNHRIICMTKFSF